MITALTTKLDEEWVSPSLLSFFSNLFIYFNWMIVILQYCDGFFFFFGHP